MYLMTHLSLAGILLEQFAQRFPLDPGGFRYGNIKPDVVREMTDRPHVAERFLADVERQAERLTDWMSRMPDPVPPAERIAFSVDLGIFCHFLSDFFCLYHADYGRYRKYWSHFRYEIHLHQTLRRLQQTGKPFHIETSQAGCSFGTHLRALIRRYENEPHSPVKDLSFAVGASIWACETLLAGSRLHERRWGLEELFLPGQTAVGI